MMLRNISASEIMRQSQQLTRILVACDFFQRSKAISCYMSMPGEVETSSIALEALRVGKILYTPRISPDRKSMKMFRVYSEADLMSMQPTGPWGIREPDLTWQGQPREEVEPQSTVLDIIFLPGVAFDASFARLGHGKGFYDRFLADYHKNMASQARPVLVGLALHEQVVSQNSFPVEEHDWKVDHILTATGLNTRKLSTPEGVDQEA